MTTDTDRLRSAAAILRAMAETDDPLESSRAYRCHMDESIALALADWLEREAHEEDVLGGVTEAGFCALRLADLINGAKP